MNTSVTLSLDTRRAKADGTFPIVLRLSHGRKTIGIPTGYSVIEKFWDDQNRRIKTSCNTIDNVTRVNNFLLKKRSEAMDLISELDSKKKLATMSAAQIKEKLKGRSTTTTFYNYTEQLIEIFNQTERFGNARSYKNVLREMKNYKKGVDFRIEEINYEFLKDFEKAYLSRGNDINGLAVYTRTIRAIFNYAIKDHLVEKASYPFDDYIIKTRKTKKRAISFDSIKKIVELKLTNQNLQLSRDIFLASFYSMGTPFSDLAFWKKEYISEGRIKYDRQKTAKPYNIKITPQLEEILNYYLKQKKPQDFIFPIIKSTDPSEQHQEEIDALINHNKRLKKIAKQAEIEEKLTSYVSRHSFATLANNKGIPVTAISTMLGHGDLRTTQTYLAELENTIIDDYNTVIIGE